MFYDQVAVFTFGTIAIALFSGAGGALLLDLYFRPRRDRKRAAVLLLSEASLNLEALLNARGYMDSGTDRGPPSDMVISRTALDLVGTAVSELPPETVDGIIITYNGLSRLDQLRRIAVLPLQLRQLNLEPADDVGMSRIAVEVVEFVRILGQIE